MPKKGPAPIEDRLNRIEGQIRGIEKMLVNEEKETRDVLIQLQAVISGLEGVKMELVKREVKEAILSNMDNALDLLK